MSRMARSTSPALPVSVLVVLLLLASCLTVHFLVQDLVFLSSQPESASAALSLDELTHQDDLALTVSPPVQTSLSWVWFVIPAIFLLQAQALSPFRHPPKI